jgi:protein TonB
MKRLLSILLTLSCVFTSYAQSEFRTKVLREAASYYTPYQTQKQSEKQTKVEDNHYYDMAEQMPSFKGNVQQWLQSNITYPAVAAENGIQGRVIVELTIEEDGSVSNVHVIRSVDPLLDREAVNVVERMPKWNPGSKYGQPIKVKITLPVPFRLQ